MRPVKKKKTILIISITLIVLFSTLWSIGYIQVGYVMLYECFVPVKPPERLDNIPSSAIWYGGRDGGVWIDFISINNNDSCYKCFMYNDWSGNEYSQGWWDKNVFCLDSGIINIDTLRNLCRGFFGTTIPLQDGRQLIPDITNIRVNFAMVKPGMSEEEVKLLLGLPLYDDDSVSTYYIWIVDNPLVLNVKPKIYFDIATNLVVKTKWVEVP